MRPGCEQNLKPRCGRLPAAVVFLFFCVCHTSASIDAVLQMQLGNPSGATVDTNNHNHYLIQRAVEALDYSDNLGEPVWVSWDLTASDIGTNTRASFMTDNSLPANFYHPHGRVIAVELQPKMLEVLLRRARKAKLAERIEARQPKGDHLGIEDCLGQVDFSLAFAMVHEVPQPRMVLADIHAALKAGGRCLLAEPAGHVPFKEFEATLALAKEVGFALESRPVIRRSHAALLVKQGAGRSSTAPGLRGG